MNLFKFAEIIETTIQNIDPEHKTQILEMLYERYINELGFGAKMVSSPKDLENNLFLIPPDTKLTYTFSGNKVTGVNLMLNDRLKGFGLAKDLGPHEFMEAGKEHLEYILTKDTWMEVSEDLFRKIWRIYKTISKKNELPRELLVYPAWVSALMMPKRKILVHNDGVMYEKRVVQADTFTNKVIIGTVLLFGQGGTYQEASSQGSEYSGKLIVGTHSGHIKVLDFDPELWGGKMKLTANQKIFKLAHLFEKITARI
jgi:hypothetical protein